MRNCVSLCHNVGNKELVLFVVNGEIYGVVLIAHMVYTACIVVDGRPRVKL